MFAIEEIAGVYPGGIEDGSQNTLLIGIVI
jgi:hypothetical protein